MKIHDPDISYMLFRNRQQKDYCGNCGGSGKIRVGVTGNSKLDFEKCGICRGEGTPRRVRGSDWEKLTQPWRKEF